MTGEIIHLLSTCHRKIYKQDIYKTLANPAGLVMHFKYRREGVPAEIWENDELCGTNVVVVAALKTNHRNGVDLYPLRRGEIIGTDKEGSVFHIYFAISDTWVDYSSHEMPFDKQMARTDNWRDIDFIRRENEEKISFTQRNVWSQIVNMLSDRDEFSDGLFYKVDDIYGVLPAEDMDPLEDRSEYITEHKKAFTLKTKTTYEVEVSFDFGSEPPEVANQGTINFVTSEKLSIFPQSVSSGFLVDKRRPSMSTGDHPYKSIEHITIEINEGLEGPNITIPLKVVEEINDEHRA